MNDVEATVLRTAHIDLLPGTADDLRYAAGRLRWIVEPLRQAGDAADRLTAVFAGHVWGGAAWQSFANSTDHESASRLVTNGIDVMEQAAAAVDALAAAHDRHQERLLWCRRELDAAVAAIAEGGDPGRGFQILAEADAIHREHHASEQELRAVFDRLDDAPILATPPASLGDRARQAVHFTADIGRAAVGATVDLAVVVAALSTPLAPYFVYRDLREHGDEYLAALDYAIDDPLGFSEAVVEGILDIDGLREDPASWIGRLVPDIALTVITAGGGSALRGFRGASRALDAVDDVTDAVRVIDGVGEARRASVLRVPAKYVQDTAGTDKRADVFAQIGAERLAAECRPS